MPQGRRMLYDLLRSPAVGYRRTGSGLLKLPVMNREPNEWGAYVRRDWVIERLRDHLNDESRMVTE